MEWFYLVLILAFFFWSVQMFMGYKRQSDRIDIQIAQTMANEEGILEQAESYESQVEEKQVEMKTLQEEEATLATRRKELESKIQDLKQKDASRRPTRHRVEPSGDE